MDRYAALAIMAFALMASATPVPPDFPSWRQGPVAAVRIEEPKSIGVEPQAQERQFPGGGGGGEWGLGSGRKKSFEYISGPYRSSLGRGFELPGGYGSIAFDNPLGLPIIGNGPLGGIMGIPLMMIMAG